MGIGELLILIVLLIASAYAASLQFRNIGGARLKADPPPKRQPEV